MPITVTLTQLAQKGFVEGLRGNLTNELIQAATSGDFNKVSKILDSKAIKSDVNAKDKNGDTALILAANNGKVEVVEKLLGKGADVNLADKNGNTALIWAANNGKVEVVEKLLAKGADVNLANKDGYTALMLAASNGKVEVVKLLLNKLGLSEVVELNT